MERNCMIGFGSSERDNTRRWTEIEIHARPIGYEAVIHGRTTVVNEVDYLRRRLYPHADALFDGLRRETGDFSYPAQHALSEASQFDVDIDELWFIEPTRRVDPSARVRRFGV